MGISAKLLDSRDLPEIFKEIYLQELDGMLYAERLKYKRCVYFKQGAPIFATSNLSEDKIGKILFTQEKVTMDQLLQALDTAKKEKKRVGAVLVELQFISAQDLFEAVIAQVEQIVTTLFSSDWKRARLSFDSRPASDDDVIRLKLHPIEVLIAGVRQSYGVEMVAANVGGNDTVFRRTDALDFDPSVTRLSEEEKRFITLMDGEASLGVLCDTAQLSEEKAYVLAFTLKMIGAIAPVEPAAAVAGKGGAGAWMLEHPEGEERAGDESPEEPAAAPSGAVRVAKPTSTRKVTVKPAAAGGAVDEEKALVTEASRLRSLDFYRRLGVPSDAGRDQIVAAWEQRREHFSREVQPELERSLQAGRMALTVAFHVLADEQWRKKYDSLLAGNSTPVELESRIRRWSAADAFARGNEAWKQQRLGDAEQAFRQAVELDSATGEHYIGLGLVLAAQEQGAPGYDEAVEMFSKATVLQPDKPRGFYYLGTVLRHRGERARAADAYRKALALDERHEPAREGLALCGGE